MPAIEFCLALYVDGPLAGRSGYAVNRLCYRVTFALPPRASGPIGEYRVIRRAEGDRPAGRRFVGYTAERRH
jgi:hypothetical protein